MKLVQAMRDGLTNLVANLGTSRDKASHTGYMMAAPSVEQLFAMFQTSWLAKKIVNIPAKDAFRRWRAWQGTKEHIEAIEREEKRLGVKLAFFQAMQKARGTGGAVIYIATRDSDVTKPLQPERIGRGGVLYLTVLGRFDIAPQGWERDIASPYFNKPQSYRITTGDQGHIDVHPSRLVVFNGEKHLDRIMETDGWGESVLTSCFTAIKNADETAANAASLVYEAKVDVISIPELMKKLGDPQQEKLILERLRLAAVAKGNNGTLILDSEEKYDSKGTAFTGLTDLLMSFVQLVSGACDIPATRLLGRSPSGLNSTGENDMRNYYDHISSIQELEVDPESAIFTECLIRSALGTRPPEIYYQWNPLWQTTDNERADISKKTADTIKVLVESNIMPPDAMARSAQNMLIEHNVVPGLDSILAGTGDGTGSEVGEDETEASALELADAAPRSLYVSRNVVNAREVLAWAKAEGIGELLGPDGMATAESLHVTLIYSRTPVDWSKAGEAWGQDDDGTMRIKPGGMRMVEVFGEGAIVLHFSASALSWRHEELKQIGAAHGYAEYMPHITLGYTVNAADQRVKEKLRAVKPYAGAIVLGPEIFAEIE